MDLSGARGCYLSLVMAFLLSYITPTSVLASDEEKGESINHKSMLVQEMHLLILKLSCASIQPSYFWTGPVRVGNFDHFLGHADNFTRSSFPLFFSRKTSSGAKIAHVGCEHDWEFLTCMISSTTIFLIAAFFRFSFRVRQTPPANCGHGVHGRLPEVPPLHAGQQTPGKGERETMRELRISQFAFSSSLSHSTKEALHAEFAPPQLVVSESGVKVISSFYRWFGTDIWFEILEVEAFMIKVGMPF